MKDIRGIQLIEGSNEELLPGFSQDLPYIASCVYLDQYLEPCVPWHWHRAVELFYVESGALEYNTPNGRWVFPAGTGGFLNSNVLHSTKSLSTGGETVQFLHLFAPEFLSSEQGSRIAVKYIHPLTAATGLEMIPLSPEDAQQLTILRKIRAAFDLDEEGWGYELLLRQQLTDIWMALTELSRPTAQQTKDKTSDEAMKAMLRHIHAHYPELISVEQLAKVAHISKRVCYRMFQDNLHTSPVEYMTAYRLRKACLKLTDSDEPVTQIAYNCGFGSSSYFGKLFREQYGCTPSQYRQKWHDRDKK